MIPHTDNSPSFLERAAMHADRPAIVDESGCYSYRDLLDASARVAALLLDGRPTLSGGRVAILIPPGFRFVAAQWGIWRAGGVAVPLALSHPPAELAYVLDDCAMACAVVDRELEPRLAPLAELSVRPLSGQLPRLRIDDALAGPPAAGGRPGGTIDQIDPNSAATILYTSGTTGKPKGVVLSHGNIRSQVESLIDAWRWSPEDRILEVLPLHHVHGLINIIACALWTGAVCEILPRFDAERVWERILSGKLTLFMAVPTIYVRLIKAWEQAGAERREQLSRAAGALRLMVSGSAALPVPVLERWHRITGHVLLERYGMTEIGMALSNPYHRDRVPGAVGSPLPGVDVRLVDAEGKPVTGGSGGTSHGRSGEIEVRGPGVFREYWQRPGATREAFRDGWFVTGDMATLEDGTYRILGRRSIDIIKCGGEKISALEIEAVLLAHPRIDECAVVGIEDPEWGQRVAAALVLVGAEELDLETLRAWAKERLAIYKVPSRIRCLGSLPRNAMGKVTKPAVVEIFAGK